MDVIKILEEKLELFDKYIDLFERFLDNLNPQLPYHFAVLDYFGIKIQDMRKDIYFPLILTLEELKKDFSNQENKVLKKTKKP